MKSIPIILQHLVSRKGKRNVQVLGRLLLVVAGLVLLFEVSAPHEAQDDHIIAGRATEPRAGVTHHTHRSHGM